MAIAAPPGKGKSTVLLQVIARARGRAVVADIDEVLEEGSLPGVTIADASAAPIWPAYNRLRERIIGFVTRADIDMVPFTQVPAELPFPEQGPLIGWEIDDEVRDSRLRRRGEPEAIIADSRSDAALLRELLPPASIVRTDASWTPEQCGQALSEAVQPNLLP